MNEKLAVIRDGHAFAVKITYYSGRTELQQGFETHAEASAWIVNRQERTASAGIPPGRRPV
jgi:hypothetical protein